MTTVIIAEKGSQARDIRAALGDRHGQVLPAEGHLLRLAEPEEVNPAWRRWSFALLKPDGLYPTRPDRGGNKPAALETGATVNVPLFVNIGDKIKVDTRSGSYMSRA